MSVMAVDKLVNVLYTLETSLISTDAIYK